MTGGFNSRAGSIECQILDASQKLRAPNAVRVNGTVSRLVLEDLTGNKQECKSTEGNVNMEAASSKALKVLLAIVKSCFHHQ